MEKGVDRGGEGKAAKRPLALVGRPRGRGPADPIRWAPPGTAPASTSRSSPRTPPGSSCACSTSHPGRRQTARIPVPRTRTHVWHVYLPEARPGQRYGYRVHGPYEPEKGHRFNPAKLLLDPYARALDGPVAGVTPSSATPSAIRARTSAGTTRDSAPERAEERGDAIPPSPGATIGPPRVPVARDHHLRAARQGVHRAASRCAATSCAAPTPAWRSRAGARLPAVARRHRRRADAGPPVRRRQRTWWSAACATTGATTRSASSPPRAATAASRQRGGQVAEFKTMVKTLHEAGIEVILDVVYNHTAEGNHLGPTLSFRGIDNAAYYRLGRRAAATTWTTPAPATRSTCMPPRTLCSSSWTACATGCTEMHVDGFRFDLASALARELHDVDRLGAFFDIIHQDPVLSQVKLIAEPWDLGEGGYQVGNFPALWAEWNGKLPRHRARLLEGRRRPGRRGRLPPDRQQRPLRAAWPRARTPASTSSPPTTASRCTTWSATTTSTTRPTARTTATAPTTTCPGTAAWKGPTDDPADRRAARAPEAQLPGHPAPLAGRADALRRRRDRPHAGRQQQRLLPGQRDELARLGARRPQRALLAFTRRLIGLRKRHPGLRRRQFFLGREIRGSEVKDLAWFRPDGEEMTDEDWNVFTRCLGLRLAGDAIDEVDADGGRSSTTRS